MVRYILSVVLIFSALGVNAQSVYVPFDQDYYHLVNRYEVINGRASNWPGNSIRPITRKDIANLADSLAADTSRRLSKRDKFNAQYLQDDNWEWSKELGAGYSKQSFIHLYQKKADFFYHHDSTFDFHVSPVLYFGASKTNQGESPYINTRGLVIRAMIGKRLGFYTYLSDNQIATPLQVTDYVNANGVIPGEGFWKLNEGTKQGYNYFTARGYLAFKVLPQIDIQVGHDKNFVGYGYRSMILSDFSNAYNFLKINTRVWRFTYTNLFTQMPYDISYLKNGTLGSVKYPDKYMAYHHLGITLRPNLQIGVFESIMSSRQDSSNYGGFDISYLNPIIFYRYMESNQGSPDNAFTGFDARWIIKKRLELYTQINLDEFFFKHIIKNDGWWGNKRGFQLGGKYINAFGIKNLDVQAEYNTATPFTYSYSTNAKSYTNYNQSLAHPLGSNFRELLGIIRYQPMNRVQIVVKGLYMRKGLDTGSSNLGANVLKDYTKRTKRKDDLGFYTLDGNLNTVLTADVCISYMVKHNLFFDFQVIHRMSKYSLTPAANNNATIFQVALRLNTGKRNWDF
jgi:hypothetical protein